MKGAREVVQASGPFKHCWEHSKTRLEVCSHYAKSDFTPILFLQVQRPTKKNRGSKIQLKLIKLTGSDYRHIFSINFLPRLLSCSRNMSAIENHTNYNVK